MLSFLRPILVFHPFGVVSAAAAAPRRRNGIKSRHFDFVIRSSSSSSSSVLSRVFTKCACERRHNNNHRHNRQCSRRPNPQQPRPPSGFPSLSDCCLSYLSEIEVNRASERANQTNMNRAGFCSSESSSSISPSSWSRQRQRRGGSCKGEEDKSSAPQLRAGSLPIRTL